MFLQMFSIPEHLEDSIHMNVSKYGGKNYIHIRQWVKSEPSAKRLIPTNVGITLSKFGWTNLKDCFELIELIDSRLMKQSKDRKRSYEPQEETTAQVGWGRNAVVGDSEHYVCQQFFNNHQQPYYCCQQYHRETYKWFKRPGENGEPKENPTKNES